MKIKDPNVRHFDQASTAWDEKPRRVDLAHTVAAAISHEIPFNTQMDALEYGCGTGLMTLKLASQLRKIIAVDISAGMLSVLKRKINELNIENVLTQQIDLTQDTPPDRHFHLIYSSMTLHHINNIEMLMQTFYQLLHPKGYVAIADLDRECGDFHSDPRGVEHHGLDRSEFALILENLGFINISSTTAYVIHKQIDDVTEREYPVFLMIGQKGG